MMNTDPLSRLGAIVERGRMLVLAGVLGAAALLSACGNEQEPAPAPAVTTEAPSPSPSVLPSEATPAPAGPHEGLAQSGDESLALLGAHEKELGYRFDFNMLFVDMPRNPQQAKERAAEMAETLRKYHKYGIQPLVIMEPTHGEKPIDLTTLSDEAHAEGYQNTLDTYFRTLNGKGITDEQMGTWALFPEANIPTWKDGITDPNMFKRNFIPAAQALKKYFQEAKVSILLEQTTYPDGDMNYERGTTDVDALLTYLHGIPAGLVDSFGIQGFPRDPNASAADYVSKDALRAGARVLGVREVWLNTGTYSRAEEGRRVAKSPEDRRKQLLDQLAQAQALKRAGYDVRILVFGQNKYPAEPDWSYKNSTERAALGGMLQSAKNAGIDVSLFDSAP